MSYFKNLSIKLKVLLLFLLPTIALVYQITNTALDERATVKEATKMHKHVELAVAIASVIHESQKERGMSAGYLSSYGKEFGDTLALQRKNLDVKVGDLKTMITVLSQEKSTDFTEVLAVAVEKMTQRDTKRSMIDTQSIKKSDAIAYYTHINKTLLNIIVLIVEESTDEKVVKDLTSYISYLSAKERLGIQRAVVTGAYTSNDIGEKVKVKLSALVAQQEAFMEGFATTASEEMMQEYEEIKTSATFNEVKIIVDKLLRANTAEALNINGAEVFQKMTKKINLVKSVEDKIAEELLQNIETTKHKVSLAFDKMLLINIVLIAVIILLGFLVIRSITQNVAILQRHMKKIYDTNDLTLICEIDSKDELGQIATQINALIGSFESLVSQAKQMSHENASISHELSTTALGVGNNVENSVSIVAETTSQAQTAQNEILSSIADAQGSKEEIIKANDNLDSARDDIISLTSKVQDTAQAELELAEGMEALSNEANEVKTILVIIGDIADQTNLLALNAAIEAARAGEHGRGFAVVADEVRKLAERTQKTLSEINATISIVVQSIGDASTQMSKNSVEIQELANIAQGVEERINSTVDIVNDAVHASDATVKDFEDTGKNVGVIIKKVEDINAISSTNARSVEEIAAAAEHLNTLTNDLNAKLDLFKT